MIKLVLGSVWAGEGAIGHSRSGMEAPDEPGVGNVRKHANVELPGQRDETAPPSAERNVRGSLVRICNLKTDTDLNGTVKCALLWWCFWM